MPSVEETVARIVDTATWDQRVAQIRLISQNHGSAQYQEIYATVARELYVPHLAPDFAYVHSMEFYDLPTFQSAYAAASKATAAFTDVSEQTLADTILENPRTLLAFRTILGLTGNEFAQSTGLLAAPRSIRAVSHSKVDAMERKGTAVTAQQAKLIAMTVLAVMDGSLFGDPPGDLHRKQEKYDTERGWEGVHELARDGVPYEALLHQRHYGGAFRQLLDATSTLRGNLLEDAVEELFLENGIPHIRTGSHNQGDIQKRFELHVTPAPDFVVYDNSGSLRAILECKLVNDGGTARDKALRFERLRAESLRLGGVPLLAVLTGLGWTRVNDTLGPVVRDTDGRVFTLATLPDMLDVNPFPSLIGTHVESE
ncbi:hypothetical protein C5D09_06880 [Rathayibacter sp. AY1C9]|uniref:hypothetical protein n=1 Tax=unclassified Rathayibacter TaxID=2609250 RepID=UPI000CE78AFC|nr:MULTISPECIES: hypothetical protein [unclassified Rathayibacter]PPH07147.1 hypothetical protein C5C71_15215 [Rathayibacter sp. AY1C1]PPH46669.1 hypothetical protein C5D09_06880 [Rathayibacter sp. AY1C9]